MPDFKTTANVPATTQTVTVPIPAQSVEVSVTVDTNNLKILLKLTGWSDDQIDVAQAVAQAESQMYSDAVGDITLIDAKWGPSIGLFQIRSLRSPQSYGGLDIWRYAWPLRDPFFNCKAAFSITKNGTDFSTWSVFTSGAYKQYLGQDPVIRTGHTAAASWWK